MSADSSKSNTWEAIGKIATLVTIFASLLGIWIWYKTPSSSLVAEVEYGTYRTHPDSLEKLAKLESEKASSTSSSSRKPFSDPDIEAMAKAAEEASAAAAEAATSYMADSTKISGQGYVRALIKNTGDIPVKDVTYRTPDSAVNLVTHEDKTSELIRNKPTLNLGEIKPNQSVEVYTWLYLPASRYSLEENISVSHAGGRGNVVLEDDPSIPEILLASPFSVLTLMGFLILLALVFALGAKAGYDALKSEHEKKPKEPAA